MSDLRTKLERMAESVGEDHRAFERLSRYRRRRDRKRRVATAGLALVVAAAGIGVVVSTFGGARPPGPSSESQLAASLGPIVRRDTPQGEAAVQLVVEPTEIDLGETVTVRLVNRGDVPLLTGAYFSVERWDGDRWVDVPWPEDVFFPTIGISVPPGGTTEPGRWPHEGVDVEPGLYRAVKSASYEDPDHGRPGVDLEAHATFRIRDGGPGGAAPSDAPQVVRIEPLPAQGVVVETKGQVSFVAMDGTVVETLSGYRLERYWASPGKVVLSKGPTSYELRPSAGFLRRLPSPNGVEALVPANEWVRVLSPPPGWKGIGHWRWATRSPTGSSVLAQWSGECEVPTAFLWPDDEPTEARVVTGDADAAARPQSQGLGWTSDGRAVVLVSGGPCSSEAARSGIYLFSSAGVGERVFRTPRDATARMWGSSGSAWSP